MKKQRNTEIFLWLLAALPLAAAAGAVFALPQSIMVFWQGYPGRLGSRWEIFIAPAMLLLTTLAFWGVLGWLGHGAGLSEKGARRARNFRVFFTAVFTLIGLISVLNSFLYL